MTTFIGCTKHYPGASDCDQPCQPDATACVQRLENNFMGTERRTVTVVPSQPVVEAETSEFKTQERELDTRAIRKGLLAMMTIQSKGEAHLPPEVRQRDTAAFREASLAAFVELGELVNECQWKSWRTYEEPTEEQLTRMLDEGADLLTFLARMFNILSSRFGTSSLDWAEAFMRVADKNEARFKGTVEGREPPALECVGPCTRRFPAGTIVHRAGGVAGDREIGEGLLPVLCVDCATNRGPRRV